MPKSKKSPQVTLPKPGRQSAQEKRIQQLSDELAKARTQLLNYRKSNEAAINSLGEGYITINVNGEIAIINSYALRVLGYEREELVGQWFPGAIPAVNSYHQPIDTLDRPISRALTSGQSVSDITQYVRKDGSVMPVAITVSPIVADGKPIGAIEVFRDLTEEMRLDIAKDEFVSLASHQLRTPATGVKSVLSMLISGDFGSLAPQQIKYLRRASEANDRQLQIIEDLLNVARVDAGKMQLDLQPVDLVEMMRECIAEQIGNIQERRQIVQLQAPSRLPAMIDAPKLRMVIDNLISNASKYSPQNSRIEVHLGLSGERVSIAVKDYGVGIDLDDLSYLFKKFSRLDNEVSTKVGGNGLGLFLAKSLVELHHGTILAVSKPGEGSIFTVLLPKKPILQP